MNYSEEYKDCLLYIDSYWDTIILKPVKRPPPYMRPLLKRVSRKMHRNVLEIPYPFLVPNDKKFNYIFYWDSFFMFKGLIQTSREWVLRDVVNNFAYLFNTYHVIPNFNSPASTGRSQPPFFTSMVLDTYNGFYFSYLHTNHFKRVFMNMRRHKKWLKKMFEVAKQEYGTVWMDEENLFNHKVNGYQLNRYGDRDIGYAHSSELESGWDFTSRFYNRCDQFLPIDLNVYLFKYERDFAKIAFHLNNRSEQAYWTEQARIRLEEINKYMWSEKVGFFYDYGYYYKQQSDFLSLAGFTPLWAGLATLSQAEKMVKKLGIFETEYGLVITAKESLAPKIKLTHIPKRYIPAIEDVIKPKQWDYPHIWPPLEYLTVIGLLKYGFVNDAKRIMQKSLSTQARIFRKYGTFFEKIDGIKGEKPESFHYENQSGFGWTNAVFYRYVKLLDFMEENGENALFREPDMPLDPPHPIAIPH